MDKMPEQPEQEESRIDISQVQVSSDIRQLIMLNESIVQSLKSQKARNDKMLDKYKNRLMDEAQRPANKFLDWTKSVEPLIDAMISSKVTEYELLKRYDHYLKEIVNVNQKYVIEEGILDIQSEALQRVTDSLLRLEDSSSADDIMEEVEDIDSSAETPKELQELQQELVNSKARIKELELANRQLEVELKESRSIEKQACKATIFQHKMAITYYSAIVTKDFKDILIDSSHCRACGQDLTPYQIKHKKKCVDCSKVLDKKEPKSDKVIIVEKAPSEPEEDN